MLPRRFLVDANGVREYNWNNYACERCFFMNKRILAVCILALLLFTLCGCSIINDQVDKYNRAQKKLNSGDYDAAIELFEELNGYENSVKYITYAKCLKLGEAGDHESAIRGLETLGTFAAADLDKLYYTGRMLEAAGKKEEAINAYRGLPTYRDSADRQKALEDELLTAEMETAMGKLLGGSRDYTYFSELADKRFSDGTTAAERLFDAAQTYLSENRIDEAYFLFGLLKNKGNATAELMYGEVHEQYYAEHTVTYLWDDAEQSFTYQVGTPIDCDFPVPQKTGFDGEWVNESGEAVPGMMGNKDIVLRAVYTPKPEHTLTVLDGDEVLFTCTQSEDLEIDYTGLYLPAGKEGLASRWSGNLPYVMPAQDTVITTVYETAAVLPEIKSAGQARVYYTPGGTYYHLYNNCTGMVNATAHTLAQAKADGKLTCENCGVMSFALLDQNAEYLWVDSKNVAHTTNDCGAFYKTSYRILPLDSVYQGPYTYCERCGATDCYEYMRQHDSAYNINYSELDVETRLLFQYEKGVTVYYYESSRYYHANPDCQQMYDSECPHTLFEALHAHKKQPCPACDPMREEDAQQVLKGNAK